MSSSKEAKPQKLSILDLSVTDIRAALDSKLFTVAELTEVYTVRITEASNFRAVLETNPDAASIAASLDGELARDERRSDIHGISILVKDNIVTKDRLEASGGSFALLGAKPAEESSLVARLRKAGAVILGKANLSEWAYFRDFSFESGWSPRGGQTLGTYYANSRSDGSSAGPAVAVSLGLCTVALGTETTGSILDPAEINNVVGLKPSRGLIGSDGAIPISTRQDVVGILARTVKDAASVLTVMAGRSDKDPFTWNIPSETNLNFTPATTSDDMKGMAIGVPRNTFSGDPESSVMKSFEKALETMTSAGATIVDKANLAEAEQFLKFRSEFQGVVVTSEFKRNIKEYLENLETNPNNLKSLGDIIEFTKKNKSEDYPNHGMSNFEYAQEKALDVEGEKYKTLSQQEVHYGGTILAALEENHVDVLAVPSTMSFVNDLAAKIGLPIIAVPLGFLPADTPVEKDTRPPYLVKRAPGIPYCITFLTKPYSDATLLRVAHAFEQLTQVRHNGPKPYNIPKAELSSVHSKV